MSEPNANMTIDALPLEWDLAALIAAGNPRTRATELTIERAVARAAGSNAVVLVEGLSDAIALEVVASRCRRDLRAELIAVVPMGGATNIGRFISLFEVHGPKLAGLYDIGAEEHVRRAIGFDTRQHVRRGSGLEAIGFYACIEDLEDEFIRSLGLARVEQIIEAQGQIRSFRKMQHEPHYRGGDLAQQLHRFIGRWRYRYARLLAEAVDVKRIPRPIEGLLEHLKV